MDRTTPIRLPWQSLQRRNKPLQPSNGGSRCHRRCPTNAKAPRPSGPRPRCHGPSNTRCHRRRDGRRPSRAASSRPSRTIGPCWLNTSGTSPDSRASAPARPRPWRQCSRIGTNRSSRPSPFIDRSPPRTMSRLGPARAHLRSGMVSTWRVPANVVRHCLRSRMPRPSPLRRHGHHHRGPATGRFPSRRRAVLQGPRDRDSRYRSLKTINRKGKRRQARARRHGTLAARWVGLPKSRRWDLVAVV